MNAWTPRDLQRQFAALQKAGWEPFFREAATDYDFDPSLLVAISSRETNLQNIIGDGGHGYGLMQIDDRSSPDWCHSGMWKDVRSGIQMGTQVLDAKREAIRAGQGNRLTVGGKGFTGKPNLTDPDLIRTSVAAYNCGLWAYYGLSTSGDPDFKTTGHDYSADVLQRQTIFAGLLNPQPAAQAA